MAPRSGWYLLAYDISNPKRLGRVYRLLKKEGLNVQGSVFFVQGSEEEIEGLLSRLEVLIVPRKDDIRAYPITKPGDVWSCGTGRSSKALILPGKKQKGRKKSANRPQASGKNWKEKVIAWFSFKK
jgi:CRISPR-associated protein Cas2